jgi:DNA-binding XRE family transcriptional regulator
VNTARTKGVHGDEHGKRNALTTMKTVSQVRRKTTERTRLTALREESGLGMREMARFCGVSPATLCRVEAGKHPDIVTALRLARFFETSVEDLFGSLLTT